MPRRSSVDYVADRVIGYQRSILVGAVIMAAGLFM
jgi:POT family proton-dependent oligopeptide transporter